MVIEGAAVRLPAAGDGYIGSGACIDQTGSNCITLEPNALGCPYEPDECSEVAVILLEVNSNKLVVTIFEFFHKLISKPWQIRPISLMPVTVINIGND